MSSIYYSLTPAERRHLQQLTDLQNRLAEVTHAPIAATESDIRARIAATAHDNEAFARTYTPHYTTSPSAHFHAEIDDILERRVRHIYVVHGPREHAKSSRVRIGLIRKILNAQVRYPLVVSEELKISRAHLEYIFTELTANNAIGADYNIEVEVYSRTEGILRINVAPRLPNATPVQIQVEAAAYKTKIKGKLFHQFRPDIAIIDDFEDTNSNRNERIGAEKVAWVLQELYPAVTDTAPIAWLGNTGTDTSALYQVMGSLFDTEDDLKAFLRVGGRIGTFDRLDDLNANETDRNSIAGKSGAAAISAHVFRASTFKNGRMEYLWPERYSPTWYENMQSTMGPSLYESEMNGNPIREGSFFRAEWFPRYDTIPDGARWYTWFDPAFGRSESSCFKSIVVVAYSGGLYYIIDAFVRQTDPTSALIEAWYNFFRQYDQLRNGGYENDFGQDDRLARDFEDAQERHGWPLPVASGSNRRGSKEARIESLEPLASQHRILFPARMNSDVQRLYNQLLAFPHGFVDAPDALESAIARLRTGVGKPASYASLGKRLIQRLRR